MVRWLLRFLSMIQLVAVIRVAMRLIRTANGIRITPASGSTRHPVAIFVPTLNEAHRIAGCLRSLRSLIDDVERIVVTDGGSVDGTQQVVSAGFADIVTLVDASPIPPGVNGKAWGLHAARDAVAPVEWILVIDADVQVRPELIPSLVTHANTHNLDCVSVATRQQVDTGGLALLHPAMLASLVIRYGIPGAIVTDPNAAQANGQCLLIRTERLDAIGGFAAVSSSNVEDVSLARAIAGQGGKVGLFEVAGGDALVTTTMYTSAGEAWDGWSRSLSMRDRTSGLAWWLRIADMVALQGWWLPAATLTRYRGFTGSIALVSTVIRFGTGLGLLRAYTAFRWPMVLAPLIDPVVVARILRQSLRRTHSWRGRTVDTRYGGHA